MSPRPDRHSCCLAAALLSAGISAQSPAPAPDVLPPSGTTALARSLEAAKPHSQHVWRDTPAANPDGTINAYIEIPKGDRRKFELDMRANSRAIDRVMPEDVGAYPVNYGFVPQTVSYDGDPFDALVLGPSLPGAQVVRGVIVGLLHMDDEKGLDSKVVLSLVDDDGRPTHALTPDEQRVIAEFFKRYKQHETGRFSNVPGWGSADDGRSYVTTTGAFFRDCLGRAGQPCRVAR
jgi:inorganic pyrophosphatase